MCIVSHEKQLYNCWYKFSPGIIAPCEEISPKKREAKRRKLKSQQKEIEKKIQEKERKLKSQEREMKKKIESPRQSTSKTKDENCTSAIKAPNENYTVRTYNNMEIVVPKRFLKRRKLVPK